MGFDNEYAARIVIDIETVASPDAESFLDPVRAPANYKDPTKIAAYQTEKLAEIVSKAALEADLCEVVAVGWWPEHADAQPVSLTRADCDEVGLLEGFWAILEGLSYNHEELRPIVGFNILGFDLPVLIRRSQLLRMPHPFVNLDRYRTNHIDLLERLTFNGKLTYRSLAFYKRRFGLDVPDDPYKGAEIAALVAAENWEAVKAHNLSDVSTTAALARRLGYLKLAPSADVKVA